MKEIELLNKQIKELKNQLRYISRWKDNDSMEAKQLMKKMIREKYERISVLKC